MARFGARRHPRSRSHSHRAAFRALAPLFALTLLLAACGGEAATTAPATTGAATARPAGTTVAATAAMTAGSAVAMTGGVASSAASPAAAGSAAAGTTGGAMTAGMPMGQGACTPEATNKTRASGKTRLVIGTGGTGGVFFPYGGGLARVITAKLPNTEVTAEVTGGSVDNLNLIRTNEDYLGMTTTDSALDAARGESVYKEKGPIAACTLAVLYQSFIHVVALDGAGINTVADMKGKRVSVGSAGSSTEIAADRVLEAAGLNSKTDIKRDTLSVAESAGAMKDRKIDAFFWIGGLPTAAVTDLVKTPNLKVKFLPTAQFVKPMSDKYGPVYASFSLPKGVYDGVTEDVPGIGIGNLLVANAKMNEQLVYDILKTLFDNQADVQSIHPEAKSFNVMNSVAGSSLPFHPGAVRYYTEKGVLKR